MGAEHHQVNESAEEAVDKRIYESVFQLSPDPSVLLTPAGEILAMNAALRTLLGKEEESVRYWPFETLFSAPNREAVKALLRRATLWSEASGEARLERADGPAVPVDVMASLFVTAGGERLLHGVLREARARKRRERLHALALGASRAVNRAADARDIARDLLEAIAANIPEATYLAFFLHEEGPGRLRALAERGLGETWLRAEGVQALAAPAGEESLPAHVLRTREPLLLFDVGLERPSHRTLLPPEATSVIVCPVLSGDRVLGLLVAATGPDNRLDLEDMQSLEIAAAEAGSALARVEASERLAAAETHYRLLLETVTDGVLALDGEGHVLEANPSAITLLGWEAKPSRPITAMLPEAAGTFQSLFGALASFESATAYLRAPGPQRWRYLRLRGSRANVQPPRYLLFVEDAAPEVRARRLHNLMSAFDRVVLTAAPGAFPSRDLAFAALEAAEAMVAMFVEATREGGLKVLAVAGPEESFIEKGETALQWARDRVASREPGLLRLDDPEDGGSYLTVIPATVDDTRSLGVLLCHGPTEAAPFEQEEDGPWLKMASDELERVLKHHRASERLRVALTREKEAAAHARRMNDELREFTLWTTHDLREPLRSLATLSSFLEADALALPREEVAAFAAKIHRDADLLKERVRALHEFSTVANEDAPLTAQNLEEVAARATEQLRALIEDRGARVEIRPGIPTLCAQAGRLELVLLNLIANGIKYGNPDHPHVVVKAAEVPNGVEIHVDDNGEGIPENLREQVFRLFYRAPGHNGIPGTGLGLAIVQRIVSQHGGEVRIETSPLGGARVVVRLPGEGPRAPGPGGTSP
ncbi:MAG TPA: ATP-binding protein [Candidatus Thermoplasmatota archaeon]|nr:ATP-binding protein [Candidatus Thermoplasmatota archaeon]